MQGLHNRAKLVQLSKKIRLDKGTHQPEKARGTDFSSPSFFRYLFLNEFAAHSLHNSRQIDSVLTPPRPCLPNVRA
jgi:hypothetical protein